MLEVEVKLRLLAPGALRERLRALQAEPRGIEEQEDTFFQHPSRDLAACDEALRVRRTGEGIEVTYKGPRQAGLPGAPEVEVGGPAAGVGGPSATPGTKVREEVNVRVRDDPVPLLESLGFTPSVRIRKRRERYRLRGVEVAIDDLAGLGTFCEIEAAPDVADPITAVEDAVQALGLSGAERYSASYLELALAAGVTESLDGSQ